MSKRHHTHHNPPPKLSVSPLPAPVPSEPAQESTPVPVQPRRWVVVAGGSFPVEGGGRTRVVTGKIITNPEYAEVLRSKGIEVKECD